jgi:nucleoside-diphosphate-sugar epimerase
VTPFALNNDRVLITGAAGWLGLNLLELLSNLKRNHPDLEVRCLVPTWERVDRVRNVFPEAEIVPGNVLHMEDTRKFCQGARGALLIHTVGVIHPRKVSEFETINVEGTKNVLQAAIEAGIKRIVAVSSNSPCGCNPHPDHRFDEFSPYNPYLNYGRSKMRMELLLKDTQKQGSIETVIARAPWFYGPYQPARQTLFFEMIRDGKAPLVGSGRNLRSMANTEKLAEGLLLAGTSPKANGQIYWLADERPYSMVEVIETVERLLETEFGIACAHKRLRLPGIASEAAYVVDKSMQALGLYNQKIHVLSEMNKTIACSVDKAKAELGYEPARSLDHGMRRSLQMCFAAGA